MTSTVEEAPVDLVGRGRSADRRALGVYRARQALAVLFGSVGAVSLVVNVYLLAMYRHDIAGTFPLPR